MKRSLRLGLCSAVIAASTLFTAPSFAVLDQMSESDPCLNGTVSAGDYDELIQNFKDNEWLTRRVTITLHSDDSDMAVEVYGANYQLRCQATGNGYEKLCDWRPNGTGDFIVRIDNRANNNPGEYTFCRGQYDF